MRADDGDGELAVTSPSPSPLRIHIVVTHLLGRGHLARMRMLASALARAGNDVTLISGGMPDAVGDGDGAGYRVVQLPAVKVAAGNFRELLDVNGAPVDDAFKTRRAEQLLRTVADDAPQVLLVESFPFGRRVLRFELLPLLEAVAAMQPRPLILSSVRDILQPRAHDRDEGAVVVSTGGGAVGFELLQTAIDARPLSALKNRDWLLLVGRGAAAAEFDALSRRAGAGITVEWARRDFADLLASCAVSVSQAGYNTALDTVAAGCRAVFVPYSRHGEAEQTLRAEKFAAFGRAVTVSEDDLSAARLADAIDRAARLDPAAAAPIRLDGAAGTVAFIERRAGRIAS